MHTSGIGFNPSPAHPLKLQVDISGLVEILAHNARDNGF